MFSPDGRGTRCTNTPSEATFSRLRSTICSGHCCQPILSENTYRHIYISIYTTKLSMKLYIIDNKSPSSTFVGMGPTVVILYNTVYSLYTFFFLFPGKKKLIAIHTADNGRGVDRHYHQIFGSVFSLSIYIIIFFFVSILSRKRVACDWFISVKFTLARLCVFFIFISLVRSIAHLL